VELRANLLACVTRHWMRDDNWLNLYGWRPKDRKPPVVVFSAAGIDMKAEGADTDRAIANVMVSALAGFFGGVDAHEHGPKSCPLFANTNRDVKYIIAPQAFDAKCRNTIGRKLGKELPALEALLKTFQ
jgi:hypothetical protein